MSIKKALVNRFDGGLAETKYPDRKNQAADMQHCDIFTDPRLLKSHRKNERETDQSGSYEFYVYDGVRRSDGKIIGVGYTSAASSAARFYRKNNDDVSSYWQQSSVTAGNTPYYNGAISYKDSVYCLSYSGTSNYLYRYDGDATATSVVSSFTESTGTGSRIPKPIMHPQDSKLYIAIGKTVFVWDGSAGTVTSGITTPYTIVGISHWGTYVALACVDGQGRSIVYLWGRDTTITTFQEVISFGDDRIVLLANMNGVLVSVSTKSQASTFLDAKITIRGYVGGTPKILKQWFSTDYVYLYGYYFVWKDVLYFLDSNNTPQVFAFGFNKNGEPMLSKDRVTNYEGETSTTCYHFFNIHDYFFFANVTGKLNRTYGGQPPLYNTQDSVYTFPINVDVALEDQAKIKKLHSVYVRCYANSTSGSTSYGTIKLEYSVDGGSFSTVFSEASPVNKSNFVIEALGDLNGDALGEGRDIQFKLTFDQGVDIAEFGYKYETVETTI